MRSLEQNLKRAALIEEYLSSAACNLFKRLKVHDLGYRIFLANFDEWQRAIEVKCPKDPIELIQMMQNRSWVEPYLVEVTRTLHNFVASAFTLVDTTRVVYRELYEPNKLLSEYQGELDNRFIKDGTCQFVKDLRQYCQHYRLPLLAVNVGFIVQSQDGLIHWGVPISRKQIEVWTRWSATSKKFIGGFEEEINLEAVMRQYRDKVIAFNSWFEGKQREAHADEWAYREELTKKIKELEGEAEIAAAEPGRLAIEDDCG